MPKTRYLAFLRCCPTLVALNNNGIGKATKTESGRRWLVGAAGKEKSPCLNSASRNPTDTIHRLLEKGSGIRKRGKIVVVVSHMHKVLFCSVAKL